MGNEDVQFTICHDKQKNIVYFLAYDPKINGTSLGLFMIHMTSHKFYKINIFAGEDRQQVNLSRIWCSFGALFVYDEDINYMLMKTKGDEEFKGHRFSLLEDIYLDEFEKNNLALLTKRKDVNSKI
ncbi:hypothetical protein RF11_05391 [Thelohanellus kitauei]|uniref:Uncharacterized protein n=1 Tax=Thelohanellus kitauei TaxID=669202 RepID=A0A0C2N1P9_THEKT|nr:hypothetical protein RF11_05391 [Thelohanellus kitauei]